MKEIVHNSLALRDLCPLCCCDNGFHLRVKSGEQYTTFGVKRFLFSDATNYETMIDPTRSQRDYGILFQPNTFALNMYIYTHHSISSNCNQDIRSQTPTPACYRARPQSFPYPSRIMSITTTKIFVAIIWNCSLFSILQLEHRSGCQANRSFSSPTPRHCPVWRRFATDRWEAHMRLVDMPC